MRVIYCEYAKIFAIKAKDYTYQLVLRKNKVK